MPRCLYEFFKNATDSYIYELYPGYGSVVQSDLPFIERGRHSNEDWNDAARRIKNHVDNVCYMILHDDNLSVYMNGGCVSYPSTACENKKTISNAITYAIEHLNVTQIYSSYTDVANKLIELHTDYVPTAHEAIIAFSDTEDNIKELIQAGETEKLLSLVCRAYNPLQKAHEILTVHAKRQVYYLSYNENNLFDFSEAPTHILQPIDVEYRETSPRNLGSFR